MAITPPAITLRHMYLGIWPFIGLQIIVASAVAAFPQTGLRLAKAVLSGRH